jgi:hypothetical protein
MAKSSRTRRSQRGGIHWPWQKKVNKRAMLNEIGTIPASHYANQVSESTKKTLETMRQAKKSRPRKPIERNITPFPEAWRGRKELETLAESNESKKQDGGRRRKTRKGKKGTRRR